MNGLWMIILTWVQTAKFTMLAFLIFTAILLASVGVLHWHWNRQLDNQDALDIQSWYPPFLYGYFHIYFILILRKIVSFTNMV